MLDLQKIKKWYLDNIGKLLMFFMVVVTVSLTSAMPYLSIIFSPARRAFIVLLCLYLLFPLSTAKLVLIAVVAIFFALILTLLEASFISSSIGDFLYFILILIFINYIKSLVRNIASK